jgi:anti-sigma28 factor (negative regulator of flagellin synthesis)
MEDNKDRHKSENAAQHEHEGRKRSPTMVKLGELAERLRKVLKLKEEVSSGAYRVPTEKVAEALIKQQAQQ